MTRPSGTRGALVGALCLLACLSVFAPVAAPATQAAARQHTLLHYGDSLAVGTGLFLSPHLRGWSIRETTSISMHADEGARGIAALGRSLPQVIVVSLGTNDDPSAVSAFGRDVREVVQAAGSTRCVIWSTVVRPPYNGISYDGYNDALRRAARRYANLRVFDWQALARANPQWFGSDGVHPTVTGYRARAAAVAKLVTSCARAT